MKEKERNIDWFQNKGKRKDLILQFYVELENIGIKDDIGLKSYSNEDDFVFRFDENIETTINDKKLLNKIYALTSKYEKLINKTCEDCGNKIKYGGSDYFCQECYCKRSRRYNYDSIGDLGFSYYDSDLVSSNSRVFVRWNEFSKANFNIDKESIFSNGFLLIKIDFKYKFPIINRDVEDYIDIEKAFSASNRTENFYKLLKHIPNNLLDINDQKLKFSLINHLEDCNICGYKSIYNTELCLVCYKAGFDGVLPERMKKYFNTIEDLYKKMQLEYHSEYSEFQYPRWENEFEKSKNYVKLFTQKELEERKMFIQEKYDF